MNGWKMKEIMIEDDCGDHQEIERRVRQSEMKRSGGRQGYQTGKKKVKEEKDAFWKKTTSENEKHFRNGELRRFE